MNRMQPASNKILMRKWLDHEKDIHRKRLRQVKSMVQCKAPDTLGILKETSGKRQINLEDRYKQIERENKILLEKMHKILKSNS